jgi:hypothetical protein
VSYLVLSVLCFIAFSSTVRQQLVKQAVEEFLSDVQTIHGDTCFTEFTDEFLKEHVKSVSVVSDTDYFSKYGQVLNN